MHTTLKCSATGQDYAIDRLQNLSDAGKPLLAEYDLAACRERFTPDVVREKIQAAVQQEIAAGCQPG